MLIELPTLNIACLFIVGSLFSQPVFSLGRDKEIALWIDFDGTIATNEAFETLALAAYASMTEEEAAQYPAWSYYGDVYYAEYLNFTNSFGSRNNISEEILYRSSSILRQIESSSFDRVAESGVFNYIKFPVLQEAAAAVTIRDGFWKMVAASQEYNITPRIASLNWSVRWIRQILREDLKRRRLVATKEECEWLKEDLSETIAIYCSEILPKGMVEGNRLDFPTRLHTGMDKVELMKDFVDKREKKGGMVLFFGDSTNDLPPLWLEPTTVGVVTGQDSGMNRTLARFGVDIVKLNPETKIKGTIREGFLYQTSEFFDVVPWLTGGRGSKKGYDY